MKNAAKETRLSLLRRVLYDAEYILYLYKYANQTQISCARRRFIQKYSVHPPPLLMCDARHQHFDFKRLPVVHARMLGF